jgi:uncharacterized BrkB/YihY/UPF0761 family membrane protein
MPMRILLTVCLIVILFIAIVVCSLAGYLALSLFIETRSICPDAFQCSDAVDSMWIYGGVFVVSAAAVVFLTRLLPNHTETNNI